MEKVQCTCTVWPTLGSRTAKEQNRSCNVTIDVKTFLRFLFSKRFFKNIGKVQSGK